MNETQRDAVRTMLMEFIEPISVLAMKESGAGWGPEERMRHAQGFVSGLMFMLEPKQRWAVDVTVATVLTTETSA